MPVIAGPRRLVVAAAAVVGVAAAAAGCSGGSSQPASKTVTTRSAPTTTSSLPTSTSTTVAVTTSVVTTPPTAEATPQDQAKAFFEAWTRGDRAAASSLGEPAAVAAIFARPWSAGDGWSFSECSGAAGSAICAWQGSGGQLQMLVRGSTGGLPVTVVDVRFS